MKSSTGMLLDVVVIATGIILGWIIKGFLEQQQRQKMREILSAEAQRPFTSGAAG